MHMVPCYLLVAQRTGCARAAASTPYERSFRMYDSLTEFMRTFSASHPVLWAFLVMGVVAATGLFLYAFWEVVLRLAGTVPFFRKNRRRSAE